MEIAYPRLKRRNMKTCDKKNKIFFSWKLVLYKMFAIVFFMTGCLMLRCKFIYASLFVRLILKLILYKMFAIVFK